MIRGKISEARVSQFLLEEEARLPETGPGSGPVRSPLLPALLIDAVFNGAVHLSTLQPHVALTAASFVWSPPKSETAEPDAAATQPALTSPTSPTTRVALNDITLDVRAGELVVVTGAVGSGKSALIRALAGALAPVRIRAQRTCHYVGWLTLPAFPSSSTVLSR